MNGRSTIPDLDKKISQQRRISSDSRLSATTRRRAAVAADLMERIKKVQDSQT